MRMCAVCVHASVVCVCGSSCQWSSPHAPTPSFSSSSSSFYLLQPDPCGASRPSRPVPCCPVFVCLLPCRPLGQPSPHTHTHTHTAARACLGGRRTFALLPLLSSDAPAVLLSRPAGGPGATPIHSPRPLATDQPQLSCLYDVTSQPNYAARQLVSSEFDGWRHEWAKVGWGRPLAVTGAASRDATAVAIKMSPSQCCRANLVGRRPDRRRRSRCR